MSEYIGKETFMLTYGDGIANVKIDELIEFHTKHNKMVTVTAVHPNARFGELEIENNAVVSFKEKPQTKEGWINGGFFVIKPDFLELIEDDSTILERYPLEIAALNNNLMCYKHHGFGSAWMPKEIRTCWRKFGKRVIMSA